MRQHDYRNPDDHRGQRPLGPGQMDQFADGNRQHGAQYDDRGERGRGYGYQPEHGDRGRNEGMRHADSTQSGYGRYGAPDVHGQPTGGYERPVYEEARTSYGQYERGGREEGWRDQDRFSRDYPGGYGQSRQGGYDKWDGRYGDDSPRDRGQYAGHPYLGSRTYGGYGDVQGYGRDHGDTSGRRHDSHSDPDYRQWRQRQIQQLDEEYDAWRGERYKKFSEEFDDWRKNRSAADKVSSKPSTGSPGSGTGQGSGTK